MSERSRSAGHGERVAEGVERGRITVWAMLVIAAVCCIGIIASSTRADGPRIYSNRSIQGAWGFGGGGHGVAVPPATPMHAPAAGLGIMTFDGKGGCSVTSIVNLDGTLIGPISSHTCVYEVNPDGTGWSEASFGVPDFPDPTKILFVIVDRGNELYILNVDLFVAGYSAKRM